MNALKKLAEISSKPYLGGKPYFGFAKLKKGYHCIQKFRAVKTKFVKKGEKSILTELKDQVLFLPQYFRATLNDNDLEELNSSIGNGEKVYLFFGGKNDETK